MNFGRREVPPLPTFESSSSSNVPRTEGAMPKAKAKSLATTRTATLPVERFPSPEETSLSYRPQRRVMLAPISSPETYFRGNQVRMSPPTSRKIHRGNPPETMGEASSPSGLRQGNEPLGEGRPMSKAVRQRKKKTALPTKPAFLPYDPSRNGNFFVG